MALSKIRNDSLEDTAVHGNRNLIINGAMQIFQRATAATAADGYGTADRWNFAESTDGAYTSERSTDNPFGTGYSIKLQCTTADTSLAAGQYARFFQRIEGQNLQHLLYGTSSAKTLTLSFWVKSSKTGTYSILLRKADATNYAFIHSYTISSANTWEKKVITITPTAGSTSFITASAGAIANDNGIGLELAFNLAQGSQYAIGTSNTWSSDANTYGLNGQVNWMDNTSNNLYLAEVQLEVGSLTEFEHLSFQEELSLCQRYYFHTYEPGTAIGTATGSGAVISSLDDTQTYSRAQCWYPVEMRARPTILAYNCNNGASGQVNGDSTNSTAAYGFNGFRSSSNGVANVSYGKSVFLRYHLTADAEL